ncbi:MAG: hypothetical protein WC455_16930 [Dehalococcoidia bacterium]|jgi:hypothetical protein
MNIKRMTVDSSAERRFLIGAIVSDAFIHGASSFYDPELIKARHMRTIAEWCFRHYGEYKKAPGPLIKDIYESHADRMDPPDRQFIFDLLESVSKEYERAVNFPAEYELKQAEKLFKRLALSRHIQVVSGLVANGEIEEAEEECATYKCVGRPETLGSNPFKDFEEINRAFEQAAHPLFTLPGALGRMMNQSFNRSQFISLMGPEKRGKTWWLNELTLQALKARCNVALFQIGDMSRKQVLLRLGMRLCGKGIYEKHCGKQLVPVPDCKKNQAGTCHTCPHKNKPILNPWKIEGTLGAFEKGTFKNHVPCTECIGEKFFEGSLWYKTIHIDKPLSSREMWKKCELVLKPRMTGKDFKLSVYPSRQLTVAKLKAELDKWEVSEGFVPDVIVIDYADNLAPETKRDAFRQEQHETWQALRAVSLERDCLIITATQAAASSYDKQSLGMQHFSEDKRKYAEVTATFGLNQSPEEKKIGLMRINTIVLREDEFSNHEVYVAQALRQGRPLLFSF